MASEREPTALELFRQGFDTYWIARYFKISEATALAQVTSERSAQLGLPSPYPVSVSHTPWPKGRVAYAGQR